MYTVKELQLTDPSLPFYAAEDLNGTVVAWFTTFGEAQKWVEEMN
jgi:hypothetical protein